MSLLFIDMDGAVEKHVQRVIDRDLVPDPEKYLNGHCIAGTDSCVPPKNTGAGSSISPKYVPRTNAFMHSDTEVKAAGGPNFRLGSIERARIFDGDKTTAHYLGQETDKQRNALGIFSDDPKLEKLSSKNKLSTVEV